MIRSTVQGNFNRSARPQVLAARFRRRGGFSLIEVAIALAIFVFGALAIVRIFPGALGVVQNSEQRAIGQRMAQSTLARLNTDPRSIPFALFDTNSGLTNPEQLQWSDYPGAVYGTPNNYDNNSLAQSAPEAGDLTSQNSVLNQSSMGHFRRVFSETHRVPATGEILLNFPYVIGDPTPANFRYAINPVIKIRRDVEGVVIDDTGKLDFTNARLNGAPFRDVDSTNPLNPDYLRRPPNSDTTYYKTAGNTTTNRSDVTFYVSYNWQKNGQVNGVQDEPKKFTDNTPPSGQPQWTTDLPPQVSQRAAGNTVVPGPVKIWFYSSVAASTDEQGAANSDFNSHLGLLTLATTSPLIGQLVSIDYTVADWRFIVTDNNLTTQISDADQTYVADQGVTIAPADARQVVLPTRYVADEPLGDSNAQLYALLRGTDSTNMPVRARASWISDTTGATVNTPDNAKMAVRPKTGQVFFSVNNLVSPMARVVYRNLEGWVQQPAIAAHFYLPYVPGANATLFPREPWREYAYDATSTNSQPIFFHASEAGKSVTASYIYQEGSSTPVVMKDVPVPIEADVIDTAGNLPANITGFNGKYSLNGAATACTKVSRAYLRDNQGRSIGADNGNGTNPNNARIIAISEIRGASIRVRSGWFDGSRYTQTSVVGYRPLDVESYNRS